MTPEERDERADAVVGKFPAVRFLGGFELDETLLVDGWEDYIPEAEVFFFL